MTKSERIDEQEKLVGRLDKLDTDARQMFLDVALALGKAKRRLQAIREEPEDEA